MILGHHARASAWASPPARTRSTGENLFRDPYPVYARLRREAPVCHFPETGEWLVTRWADCQTIGAKDALFGPSDSSGRPEARVMGMPNILTMSGPSHACLRKGIDSNLSGESVNGFIEDLARPIIRRYIDASGKRGRPTSPRSSSSRSACASSARSSASETSMTPR